MELYLLKLQNILLEWSPGLLPLAFIPVAAINSTHCAFMCGPLLHRKTPTDSQAYLKGRLLGYSTLGLLAGAMGKMVLNLGPVISLIFFCCFALIFFLSLRQPNSNGKSHQPLCQSLSRLARWPHFFQGVASAGLPCPLLYLSLSLAAITRSPVGGALCLFILAVMSTPALAWSRHWTQSPWGRRLRYPLLVLMLLNLAYFLGQTLFDPTEVQSKWLFCL